MDLHLNLGAGFSAPVQSASYKALLEYPPPFRYYVNDSGNMVIENKGTSAPDYDMLLYSGRALELGATNDLPIPTFASGYITYFDFATNEFVQVPTDGTDYVFNSQTINNILVHHVPFSANDLAALNSNPNLMAKLAMSGSSIPELSMVLQGDEQWYPCSEESEAGVLSKVLNPTAGRTIFTTSNATTNITFRAPVGEGLYVNGTYYEGQDGTDVTATASGSTIELVESTDGVLTKLEIYYQGLNGTAPDFSSNLQLTYVKFNNNNLSGALPDFSSNPQLEYIKFGENNLSGQIPDLSSNPQLKEIDLYNNHLSGQIPDLSSNPQLTLVHVGYNNLSGPAPDFSSNPNISSIFLFGNNLSGSIQDFSSNPNLVNVYLFKNNFTGSIPDFTPNKQLATVYLYNNNFSDFRGGTITVTNAFYANNNALTVTAVDGILQALVDGGTTGSVTIHLEGGTNGVPTNTTAIDTLRSRGCTVTVNGGY